MTTKQFKKNNRKSGSVLIVIVFLVAFSTIAIVNLLSVVATDVQIAGNELISTKALYVAQAGVEAAIAELRTDPAWNTGFTEIEFPMGSGSMYTVIVNNVNQMVTLTSTGTVSGFQRKLEVKVLIINSESPYPVRVLYWKEL